MGQEQLGESEKNKIKQQMVDSSPSKDRDLLKKLRQELEWKSSEVESAERAVEFGRCKQCNEPLFYNDKAVKGNYCFDYPRCEPHVEPIETLEVKLGQIFTIDGNKYLVILPKTDEQLKITNAHGHIVYTLTGI